MKLEFVCKNYVAPDKLKDVVAKKLERLNKYFEGAKSEVKCKVLLKQEKDRQTVEITIFAAKVIRSEVTGMNMYDIIDVILPKLERQIIKFRTLPHDKNKKERAEERVFYTGSDPVHDKSIVRTKSFELNPITVDEAIEQLELLDHSFYVYLDKSSSEVCVAYRREAGQYGVINTKVVK